MVVNWTDDSKRALRAISSYYHHVAGRETANKLVADIRRSVQRLERSPRMAPIDLLLEGLPERYRSLVVKKNFKVIYYIDEQEDCVYIIYVWDFRQDPKKLIGILNDWE
ncbi:Plasmid stabilization system protein [Bacteroidales bacterium Barb7]|nr:Plasmid stabilization system protein [Bacteroidales bacterium Barb7]